MQNHEAHWSIAEATEEENKDYRGYDMSLCRYSRLTHVLEAWSEDGTYTVGVIVTRHKPDAYWGGGWGYTYKGELTQAYRLKNLKAKLIDEAEHQANLRRRARSSDTTALTNY